MQSHMAKAAPRPCRVPFCKHLRPCPVHPIREPMRDRPRYHQWYQRKEWKTLRATQLRREPFCRECTLNGQRIPATQVDHKIPHRGDIQLFFSRDNLQSLCHTCHSRKTKEEVLG